MRRADRSGAEVFGAYIRLLRQNCQGAGRGKTLRQLARQTGLAPSVLSRGERGLQDLRRPEYLERLAPHLGMRPSVLRRVAAALTDDDLRTMPPPGGARGDGVGRLLYRQLLRQVHRLRDAPPEMLDAALTYLEFLTDRRPSSR